MNPACAAPMPAAATNAMGMLTDAARIAGHSPLNMPRYRNACPRLCSLCTPASSDTHTNPPPPTAIIRYVNEVAPSLPS